MNLQGFSPTAECYGVFAQYIVDFGVFWASWGGSGKEPGSGNRFRELIREPVLGDRFCGSGERVSMGSDRFCGSKKPGSGHQGSGFRRLRARGLEDFGVQWVPMG